MDCIMIVKVEWEAFNIDLVLEMIFYMDTYCMRGGH